MEDSPENEALTEPDANEEQGPGARVAVELGAEAARTLVATILAVLDEADEGGFLE